MFALTHHDAANLGCQRQQPLSATIAGKSDCTNGAGIGAVALIFPSTLSPLSLRRTRPISHRGPSVYGLASNGPEQLATLRSNYSGFRRPARF